jgi:ligand-binding SRPBCC domain-containing protein
MMQTHLFHAELWLPRTRGEVFAFFAESGNLELLTPPWLNIHILTPRQISMRAGVLIDYRLRIHGIPLRWQSEITIWEPPPRFVDEQRRGPYRLWHHEHTFEERDRGTLCRDTVRYAVPLDILTHRFFVRPDIESIFEFRQRKMRELFSSSKS